MRRLAHSLALLGCLVPGVSYALGLGEIEVESALNQPLKARIELVAATPAEINSLRVKLASPEVFARVGIDRPFYLTELQFEPVVEDGVGSIEVTTRQNVREPFLNFLVEVSWSTGRLLREYTVLLDPPLFVEESRQVPTQAPVVTSEPAPVPAPVSPEPVARTERVAPPPAATAPAPVAPATMERLPAPSPSAPEGIAVQSGDTLWSLATQNRPDAEVTVEQMMMALLRANPEAFGRGNINSLKKGYVLRLPSRDEIGSLSQAEAFDAVQEQHALWREYRSQLAGDAVPQQISTEGAEPPATAAEDASGSGRLEILGAGDAASSTEETTLAQADAAALQDELAMTRQTLEARRQENEELQARVMELEQILSDKDRLLLLKDDELAELQARIGEPGAEVSEPVTVSEEVVEEAAAAPEALEPEPAPAEEITEVVPTEEQPDTQIVSEEAVEEPREMEPAAEVIEAPSEEMVVEEPPVEEVVETPAPVVEPPPPVAVEPPRQPSFFEDLTSRPNFLAIAGIGALLVVLVLVLIVRRMRRGGEAEEVEPFEEPEVVATGESAAPVMAGMAAPTEEPPAAGTAEPAGAAAAAASEVDLVTAGAAPEGEAAAAGEEIESDDTTAEADVYLAYGLHQQAEELLKGALASNPDKDVYRLKLLETYFATKDSESFNSMAQELHDRLGETKGLMWSRAVVMGQEISPDNPLFSSADVSGLSASDFTPRRPESADIDLGLGEDLEPSPSLDIGLDDSEQPTGELPRGIDFGAAALGGGEAAEEASATRETEITAQPGTVEETAEIEFDLSDLDVSASEEPTGADEITDVNVEVGKEPETEESSSPGAYEAETEEVDLAPTSETMEVDVSDLDLGQPTQETRELEAGIGDLGMEEEEGLIAGGDEVSTKLDLAKAYIDMGDAEGARSTLEEVIAEGNEEQRREAEELMSQIA